MNDAQLVNHLIKKAKKRLKSHTGEDYSEELISYILNYQFKFVRNCMRGGAEVVLDKFGSFSLIKASYARKKQYVDSQGGWKAVLKEHEVTSDIPCSQVIYSHELDPDKVIVFPEDEIKETKKATKEKLGNMFSSTLTGFHNNIK